MQRKSALIAESVEGVPVSVLRRRRVVFPLIEERSGLLAFEAVVVKAHTAVHGEDGRTLLSPKQSGLKRRQLLKLSNACIHALDDSRGLQFIAKRLHDRFAHGCGIHRLGEDLNAEHVVIAIDNQARHKISFAEDDAVSIGI